MTVRAVTQHTTRRRLRAWVSTFAVGALSTAVMAMVVAYLVVTPTPALAFTAVPHVSASKSVSEGAVLYGTVTGAKSKPVDATITAIACQAQPGRDQGDDFEMVAARSGGSRRLNCDYGRADTARDGTWRLAFDNCGSGEASRLNGRGRAPTFGGDCFIVVVVHTDKPRAAGSTYLRVDPGTTTRVDIKVTTNRHPWIQWLPSTTY